MLSEIPNYIERVIGNEQLQVPSYAIPEYDPDLIETSLENTSEEFTQLRADLKKFLRNSRHFSLASMAKFLGTTTHTLRLLLSKDELAQFNSQKAQTILILRTVNDMESDSIKFKAGVI
jgi:hypothetical protein